MTLVEFRAKVLGAGHEILRRAVAEGALELRVKSLRPGLEVESPFNLSLKRTREEQYVERLQTVTTEVTDSFDAMRHVQTYLARFPFSSDVVPYSAYIRYHLEAFLNEAYILRCRMNIFTTFLAREFRQGPQASRIKSAVEHVQEETKRLFDPLSSVRGKHVHGARYNDPELQQLMVWEMFAPKLQGDASAELAECADTVRTSNFEFVKQINDGLQDKLDQFFDFFSGLVFTATGDIRYPLNIRGAREGSPNPRLAADA